MRARWLWVTALFACGAEVEATDKHVEEKLAVVLPRPPGDLAPSHLRVLGAIEEDLSDVERCAPCHADVVAQWRSSAHARASFGNPWYRATIDAFREERGFEASRFCAGCHDLALLVDGAMDEAIDPADRRAHVGVTCLVCHSMQERYADGNGSFALRIAPAPLPDPNSAAQVAAHRERMNPPGLRTSGQCGGCHRSFLGGEMGNPHHLPGIDDIGAWRSSAFAESNARQIDEVEPATCQQCHMSQEEALRDFAATEGRVASHRVRGAHTPLREDHALRDAVTIDIAAAHVEGEWILPAEDATPRGSEMAVDLVIRNVGAGHRFPGGTRDLQYTYVDIEVRDARGRVLGRITGDDAFRFRAALVNEEGAIEETHFVDRFRAAAFDRTLAPRDAIVLRAITALPRRLALPLTVHAAVRHQRHPPAMRELACEATRSARGEAFARASAALGRTPLDGCAPEPVTTVAETTRVMGAVNAGAVNAGAVNAGAVNAGAVNAGAVNAGAGAEGHAVAQTSGARASFRRFYDYALGLTHAVQERLDEARPVLERALTAAATDAERAATLVLFGRVAGRQGRLTEALEHLDEAETLLAGHPAIARTRGDAYAQVWQWAEAAEAYAAAAEVTPGDASLFRDLARARGSAGDDAGALEAAQAGLRFAPRHPDLLRSQSLAFDALSEDHEGARAAFLAHRRVDEQPELLRRCQRSVPNCDRDRQPIPELRLTP